MATIGAAVLGWSAVAFAQQSLPHDPKYYSYHPQSPLALGKGFSPARLEEPKAQCVKGTAPLPDAGAISTRYDSHLVFNAEQLKEVLKIDAKIDASYLTFSASASFNYRYSGLFTSNSLTFVVQAESEFKPRHFLPPHDWEDFVKALMKSSGGLTASQAVYQACGTHIALVERRGAAVAALLTVRGMSQQERTEIAASIEGKGGVGVASGSFSAQWSREIDKASRSGRLEVRVLATGGGGIDKLGDLVRATLAQPDTSSAEGTQSLVAAIGQALGKYLDSAGSEHAAPLGFHVGRIRDIFPSLGQPALIEEQRIRRVTSVVERYRAVDDRRRSALSVLSGVDPRSPLLDEDRINALQNAVSQIEDYLDNLASLHESCRDVSKPLSACQVPPEPQWAASVPAFPDPPRASYRIKTDHGIWDSQRSAAVAEGGWEDLLQRTRQRENEANTAGLLVELSGAYLESAELRFIPSAAATGVDARKGQLLTALNIQENGSQFVVVTSEEGPTGLLRNVLDYKTQQGVEGSFVLSVTDRLRRTFDVEIARVRWVGPTSVVTLTVN